MRSSEIAGTFSDRFKGWVGEAPGMAKCATVGVQRRYLWPSILSTIPFSSGLGMQIRFREVPELPSSPGHQHSGAFVYTYIIALGSRLTLTSWRLACYGHGCTSLCSLALAACLDNGSMAWALRNPVADICWCWSSLPRVYASPSSQRWRLPRNLRT